MLPTEAAGRPSGDRRSSRYGAYEPTREVRTDRIGSYARYRFERHVLRGYALLAAAFIARLCSRTFVSDSGETMSATERNEPSSP